MISTAEAMQLILDTKIDYGLEEVDLQASYGRVLREEIRADRDFPPFNRVCMDGIAIDHSAYAEGVRRFKVEGIQAAGTPERTLMEKQNCIEVMTGATLPCGTSTVIRYEDLRQDGDAFVVEVYPGDNSNIHYQGHDKSEGDVLLSSGHKIRGPEIAICATVGRMKIEVAKLPRVAVISTGDELVEIGENPESHQIRKSNVHMLAAELRGRDIEVGLFHLNDKRSGIESEIGRLVKSYDVLILSGGVSKGKFDYVPEVLEGLGVEKLFHRVSQRPGKPFWFGKSSDAVIFALPGNPVSTYICYKQYFEAWLEACIGQSRVTRTKRLAADYQFKPSLTLFALVRLDEGNSDMVHILKTGGSGDMVTLAGADGYVVLPSDRVQFSEGEVFEYVGF